MAVGEDSLPTLAPVGGLRLGTVSAGIKTPGRNDLVLIEVDSGTNAAAVFTRNAFCAAPVTVAREHLVACGYQPRYLLVNTGNANARTSSKLALVRPFINARALEAAARLNAARGLAPNLILPAASDWPGWVASTSLAM